MADVTIKVNPTLAPRLKEAAIKGLEAAAVEACKIIQRRTRQGIAWHGGPFPQYTRAYRKKKEETGRSGDPNLTMTGELLRGLHVLRVEPAAMRVVIGWDEVQHRATPFVRVKSAWKAKIWSARGGYWRTLKSGKRIWIKRDVDLFERKQGPKRGFRLDRGTNKTVLTADVVVGLSRKFPFFAINDSQVGNETHRLIGIIKREMAKQFRARGKV